MSIFARRHRTKVLLGLGVTVSLFGVFFLFAESGGRVHKGLVYAQEYLKAAGSKASERNAPQAAKEGKLFPLTINGKQWTFRTPPPENLKVREKHPRFLLPGHEEEIHSKLTDPRYTMLHKLAADAQPMAYQALVYAMSGSRAAGEVAKAHLLSLAAEPQGGDSAGNIFFEIMIYDWCNDLFNAQEREQALHILCERVRMHMPKPGSTEFEAYSLSTKKGDGFGAWFDNDIHNPRQYSGFLWRGLVALAFHGDGVRDEWCEYVYQAMLNNTDARIYPVYDPQRGGLVDSHNQRALDSGGIQSGWNHNRIMDGYEG